MSIRKGTYLFKPSLKHGAKALFKGAKAYGFNVICYGYIKETDKIVSIDARVTASHYVVKIR